MKKLLVVSLAVLATAGVAMAAPSFTLPAQIDLDPGTSVDVFVGGLDLASNVTPAGNGIQGMNLFLGASTPFQLSGLHVDDLAGLGFFGNSTGATNDIYDAQTVGSSVTTLSGVISVDGPLARITVSVPLGTPVGTQGILSTALHGDFEGVVSDFGGPQGGQATAILNVTPEPATALMLLGVIPFLRRRRA